MYQWRECLILSASLSLSLHMYITMYIKLHMYSAYTVLLDKTVLQYIDRSLQASVTVLATVIHFGIKTPVRSITASKEVYWVQIFQGKSECLLEQKAKGEGSGSEAKRGRKEEGAGESGVHKKCQKKILLSSSQAFVHILSLLGSLFLHCGFCCFFP